jgi:LacI family gluconate utilization system Gnt-I transcriptional repressor
MALEAAGLTADPARSVEIELSIAGGAAALRTLLERQAAIDAIFCSTDVLAAGVLLECQRRGLQVAWVKMGNREPGPDQPQ